MLEAKDTKKIRGQGQGQPFRGQTLSRPRTGMLKAKDTGAILKKKRPSKFFFRRSPKTKKVFKIFFQAISKQRRLQKFFSGDLQILNYSNNSAVLEPRIGQFSRIWGFEAMAKAKDLTFEAKDKDFKMCS